jgi:hypothetical protein
MNNLNRTEIILTAIVLIIIVLNSTLVLAHVFSNGFFRNQPTQSEENTRQERIFIENAILTYDPTLVETVRPDLFKPGHFALFDILVHLGAKGAIDLQFHFDDSMNTHVIDSMNGEVSWWYMAFYDGGWWENNVFRMDHYPWKNNTTLKLIQVASTHLDRIYSMFREEVVRKTKNALQLVIPTVTIRGRTFTKTFKNVTVTPHNMRIDLFEENITTALDVIMSLGDLGKLVYELMWYDSIGTAETVRSYWVESIDSDSAHDRCGFVYESGSTKFRYSNHIHIPTDIRVLNSPEYVEFFWICI